MPPDELPPFAQPDPASEAEAEFPFGLDPRLVAPPTSPPVGRAEAWRAALGFALLALVPVFAAVFSTDRILLGVDTAAAQLPWRAALEEAGVARPEEWPRNPGLWDQGVVFYPYYRWATRSWLEGDAPLWNPDVYAGAPGIGNPQAGIVDPQVWLLVALEAIGGRAAFDWGFGALGWLRLFAAGLGAYLLARKLGLRAAGGAVAGIGFGLSGYLVLWLGHPLGHVPPLLPWLLLALEATRGSRPARAAGGASIALGLAILGGHPETSFYVGLAGGLWALAILRENLRAGAWALVGLGLGTALGGALLLPFLEYLEHSGAQLVRQDDVARRGQDLASLGILIVAIGAGFAWALRGERPDPATYEGVDAGEHGPAPHLGRVLGALGLALTAGGAALLLRSRGLPETAALAFVHDHLGAPGDGVGYLGPRSYLEEAGPWLPTLTLAGAVAAMLAPLGPLRRRRLIAALGFLAFLLALRTPGVLNAYELVPVIGLGATVRFSVVSALFLPLLAGEAVEAAPRIARIAGVVIVLATLGALVHEPPVPPLEPGAVAAPQQDELFQFVRLPEQRVGSGGIDVVGWVDPQIELDRVVLALQRVDLRGEPIAGVPIGHRPALLTKGPPAKRGAE